MPSLATLMKLLPILAIIPFLRKELISIIIYLQSSKKNKGIWHKEVFLAWKSAPHLSSRGDCTGILVWNRRMCFYLLLEKFWWINQNLYHVWMHWEGFWCWRRISNCCVIRAWFSSVESYRNVVPEFRGTEMRQREMCFRKFCLLPRTNSAAFRQNMHLPSEPPKWNLV